MSETIISIYVIVMMSLTVALLIHAALRHRHIVSILIWWAFIGIFLSTVGGLLMQGTFTPGAADYSNTANELYNAYTWGGIYLPEYNDMLSQMNNLGIVINALGLGVLVMAVLSGFFPRTFFPPIMEGDRTQTH